MRSALMTASIVGVLVLVPFTAASASADAPVAAPVLAQSSGPGTDTDEPALQDGNDDTGKYGLIGLSGLLGLFDYKKYRDTWRRPAIPATLTGPRTASSDLPSPIC